MAELCVVEEAVYVWMKSARCLSTASRDTYRSLIKENAVDLECSYAMSQAVYYADPRVSTSVLCLVLVRVVCLVDDSYRDDICRSLSLSDRAQLILKLREEFMLHNQTVFVDPDHPDKVFLIRNASIWLNQAQCLCAQVMWDADTASSYAQATTKYGVVFATLSLP
ncbi:hypothetical protein Tco_0785069 [Tanacetum coccineum]